MMFMFNINEYINIRCITVSFNAHAFICRFSDYIGNWGTLISNMSSTCNYSFVYIHDIDTQYILPDNSIADLLTSVYGNLHENMQTMSRRSTIILCPKNETADLLNNHVIHLLSGEGTIY